MLTMLVLAALGYLFMSQGSSPLTGEPAAEAKQITEVRNGIRYFTQDYRQELLKMLSTLGLVPVTDFPVPGVPANQAMLFRVGKLESNSLAASNAIGQAVHKGGIVAASLPVVGKELFIVMGIPESEAAVGRPDGQFAILATKGTV